MELPGGLANGTETGNMVLVPGGNFVMGSDRHYAEEAPAHPVTVDSFWMDATPVTNRQFLEFVNATGHVTVAEKTPNAKDYPGAEKRMLRSGSLVFDPPFAARSRHPRKRIQRRREA